MITLESFACVVSAICAIMDDINTEHNMKSICRAALLNDNAPDSNLSVTGSSLQWSSNFCYQHICYNSHYKLTCQCENTIFICFHAIEEQ